MRKNENRRHPPGYRITTIGLHESDDELLDRVVIVMRERGVLVPSNRSSVVRAAIRALAHSLGVVK